GPRWTSRRGPPRRRARPRRRPVGSRCRCGGGPPVPRWRPARGRRCRRSSRSWSVSPVLGGGGVGLVGLRGLADAVGELLGEVGARLRAELLGDDSIERCRPGFVFGSLPVPFLEPFGERRGHGLLLFSWSVSLVSSWQIRRCRSSVT